MIVQRKAHIRYQCWVGKSSDGPREFQSQSGAEWHSATSAIQIPTAQIVRRTPGENLSVDMYLADWEDVNLSCSFVDCTVWLLDLLQSSECLQEQVTDDGAMPVVLEAVDLRLVCHESIAQCEHSQYRFPQLATKWIQNGIRKTLPRLKLFQQDLGNFDLTAAGLAWLQQRRCVKALSDAGVHHLSGISNCV